MPRKSAIPDLISDLTGKRIATPGRKPFFRPEVPVSSSRDIREMSPNYISDGCLIHGCHHTEDELGGEVVVTCDVSILPDGDPNDPLNCLLRREAGEEDMWDDLPARYLRWLLPEVSYLHHLRLLAMMALASDSDAELLHIGCDAIRKGNRARTCTCKKDIPVLDLAFG